MLGLLLECIGAFLVVAATARAVVVSRREQFAVGKFIGAARLVAAVIVAWATIRFAAAPPAPMMAVLVVSAEIGGPVLSAVILFFAWRRYQDVPAADEERLERPFGAWLPVAILDAFWGVILIGAAVLLAGP